MKVLLVSDSHGDQEILQELINTWQNQVDLMIHCGDAELPASLPVMKAFVNVLGNNDVAPDFSLIRVVDCHDERFLITHGHRYQVNFSLTPLMLKGEEQGADVICYGHTHQLAVTVEKGMLMINPGSISLPRGKYAAIGGTYAIVEVTPKYFVVDYYNRSSIRLPELHFKFTR